MHARKAVRSLGSISLMLVAATAGRAETTLCTSITALPATISSSGVYCLKGNLTINTLANGGAITINANDVVLDLNGHRIANNGGASTLASGIYAYQRQNITIKNGIIRGFEQAIWLNDVEPYTASRGHLITDIEAVGNWAGGLMLRGSASIIQRNRIVATGGGAIGPDRIGVEILGGHGNRVVDNDIVGVRQAGGTGYGLFINDDQGVILGNRITDADMGMILFSPTTKYRDNVTTNVTTPYQGGTDAGNND